MARPRSDIRQRIERAARAQFLTQGVDGASLRAIATEAGTSIGMVYYYFPTKDDLFLAIVESVYRGLLADAGKALQPDVPIAERLRRLYERIWRMTADEYAVVRLVLREAMVSAARVRKLVPLFARGHVALLFEALQSGVEEGALRGDLPPVAMLVMTMSLGMMPMLAWRVAGERLLPKLPLPPPGELSKIFSTLLLGGMGARAEKPGSAAQRVAKPRARRRHP